MGGSRASLGEFTRGCAGKGESSRAFLAQVIAEALWLLTKAEDETSSSAFFDFYFANFYQKRLQATNRRPALEEVSLKCGLIRQPLALGRQAGLKDGAILEHRREFGTGERSERELYQ